MASAMALKPPFPFASASETMTSAVNLSASHPYCACVSALDAVTRAACAEENAPCEAEEI